MTLLNTAARVYRGSSQASAVYAGPTKVWPPAPPFSPASVAGLLAWYDASQLLLADGVAVAAWPDRSPAARNALQGVGSLQPLCRTNVLNGQRVVRFDGVDDVLLAAPWLWPQEHSVAVVYRCNLATIPTGQGIANAGTNPSRMFQLRQLNVTTAESAAFNTVNASVVDDFPGPTQTWLRMVYVRTLAGVETFVNGASDGPTAVPGTAISVSVGLYLGAANFNLKCGAVDIAELAAYDHALTAGERGQLDAYLHTKWNV